MIETITNPKSKVFKQKRYHEQRKEAIRNRFYGVSPMKIMRKKKCFFFQKKSAYSTRIESCVDQTIQPKADSQNA